MFSTATATPTLTTFTGNSEPIVEFRSRFDGMIMNMARRKVIIPPLLLVMIFLCALHTCYSDILVQFRSRYKDLDTASINSVVADVKYHDEFQLVDPKLKNPQKGGPGALAVAIDNAGKEWKNPFEWLSSFSVKTVKTRWDRAIAGTGICPICHRAEKPWHVPANCLLLKELNLKLVNGPPATPALPPAPSPAPASASAFPPPEGVLLPRMILLRVVCLRLLQVSWLWWLTRIMTPIRNFVGLKSCLMILA